ncbi:hypothetical protein B0H14DRAFT_3491251 [Mycena olivaceomarginata]|nr:hypothetical protein B0H14DRAFT_3491251 [Mycena olivaceomarginata]
MPNCARDHLDFTDWTRRLLEARLSASKVQSRLLETHSVETWEELVEYLQNLHDIMQKTNQCAKDVKEIQTSTLLNIEAERQRQLFEGIKECCEIRRTIIGSSARRTTHTATRRSVIRNSSYEWCSSIPELRFLFALAKLYFVLVRYLPPTCIYKVTPVSVVYLWTGVCITHLDRIATVLYQMSHHGHVAASCPPLLINEPRWLLPFFLWLVKGFPDL